MGRSIHLYCWTFFLIWTITLTLGSYDRVRFPGKYCRARHPKQRCCSERNDDCSVSIGDLSHSSLCYCDNFCDQHSVEDCCPDFQDTCRPYEEKPPPQGITGECYTLGEKCKLGCNECTCVEARQWKWPYSVRRYKWQCANLACINDEDMISQVNNYNYRYGWTATAHANFSRMSLKDGMKHFLGTFLPKASVLRQNSMSVPQDFRPAYYFDARSKWPGLIQPAMNQGKCASSWVFSATGVAADRLAIQSKGIYSKPLSAQQIISCSQFPMSRERCEGGRVEDAWWWLQHEGVVDEECYPYTSGYNREKGVCMDERSLVCTSREPPLTHRTTPAYRIKSNETAIMYEIQTNGPVQAIIKVRADFFLYQRGVYSYTRVPDHMTASDQQAAGYHSVRIIGWGVSGRVKYWLAVNSWGPAWGEGGLFRIKRGENESDIERFVMAAWARIDTGQSPKRHKHRHV